MNTTGNDVYTKLQAMVGEEAGPFEAVDEVNRAMIRHWCEAMEDENPLYSMPKAANTAVSSLPRRWRRFSACRLCGPGGRWPTPRERPFR